MEKNEKNEAIAHVSMDNGEMRKIFFSELERMYQEDISDLIENDDHKTMSENTNPITPDVVMRITKRKQLNIDSIIRGMEKGVSAHI